MVRAVRFHEYGDPEVLRIEPVEVPEPGPGEVQIEVKALGLNRAEALLRRGNYIERPVLPSGLGLEAAGRVRAVGVGVESVRAGDAVSIIPPIQMTAAPTYSERIVVPETSVVKHPALLGWEEAAATWMPFLTAYGALVQVAGMRSGDFVAITAASSSVGLAAIQIANKLNAVPVAITRTGAKAEALREAGAAHVIVLEDEALDEGLKRIAGGAGIRVVLDAVGGQIFEPLSTAMSRGGILIEYGGLSPDPTRPPFRCSRCWKNA